ncbi:cysteine desulfurase family protein [Brooklawnia cerclae]
MSANHHTAPSGCYLDHAAGSPLRPQARAAMADNADMVGNPAALHGAGRAARALLEDSREQLAALVGAQPDEVVFTSGGSEADTIAVLQGAASRGEDRPGVLVGAIEHPAVGASAGLLGARVGLIPVDAGGQTDLGELERLLTADAPAVGLVSLMWVNNELGTVQPVGRAAGLAGRAGALFHTDAVQALGQVRVRFGECGADLMSLSAHKVGGPVGIGALIVRRGVSLPAWGLGGRQEGGLRSGTQAAVLAAGFAAAAARAVDDLTDDPDRYLRLRERLVAGLGSVRGTTVNGDDPVGGAIVNVTFDATSAEDVTFLLDQQGIWASTGSACRAGVHGPSEVLLAMGRDDAAARASVRFSMGWTTTPDDIDHLLGVLPGVVERARRVPH